MSCENWEEKVALFAGGDLETDEAAAVERHLSRCKACSSLAADLRAGVDGLCEIQDEPIAAAHYVAVRRRVLAELAETRPRRLAWMWAWTTVALATAAGAWVVSVEVKPSARPATPMPRVVAAAPQAGTPMRDGNHSRPAANPARAAEREAEAKHRYAKWTAAALAPGNVTLGGPPGPAAAAVTAPVTEPASLPMVQLATDDPNVVIYWLLENTGEER